MKAQGETQMTGHVFGTRTGICKKCGMTAWAYSKVALPCLQPAPPDATACTDYPATEAEKAELDEAVRDALAHQKRPEDIPPWREVLKEMNDATANEVAPTQRIEDAIRAFTDTQRTPGQRLYFIMSALGAEPPEAELLDKYMREFYADATAPVSTALDERAECNVGAVTAAQVRGAMFAEQPIPAPPSGSTAESASLLAWFTQVLDTGHAKDCCCDRCMDKDIALEHVRALVEAAHVTAALQQRLDLQKRINTFNLEKWAETAERAQTAEAKLSASEQENQRLREALQKICDEAGGSCGCEDHTSPDCCNNVGYACTDCISGAALDHK